MMLHGKTALVTGSSQGIGLAVAKAYLEAGARVVLTSEQPANVTRELTSVLNNPHAHYLQANLLVEGECARLVEDAARWLGPIDILVNNVGTWREPSFLQLKRSDFDFIFGLNVWSAIELAQVVVRYNQAQNRGGRIVFTSSLNASRSEPAHTLYDASKGAINALTRQLAIELAPFNFTTIAIAPGLVETPLTDFGLRSEPEARQSLLEQIPVRAIAHTSQIAPWFVFVASDKANYATGAVIIVDGGLDAQQMSQRPIGACENK